MKKIFPALMLTMIVGLFSSCVIVTTSDTPTPTYAITFCNESNDNVIDWYVKNSKDKRFAISDDFCIVTRGSTSKLWNLPKDDYKVLFAFLPNTYYQTNYIELNVDTEFHIYSGSSYTTRVRSAVVSDSDFSEYDYILVDSNGNTYPLVKAE